MGLKEARKLLSVGQIIEAKILRIIDQKNILVSIGGNYVQVENHSDAQLKIGGHIQLIVDNQNPLRLKLYKNKSGRLNYNV